MAIKENYFFKYKQSFIRKHENILDKAKKINKMKSALSHKLKTI